MKYYFGKWSSNWADEMTVDAFKILTEEEYEKFQYSAKILKKYEDVFFEEEFTVSIGTNEEIEYENAEQFLESFNIKEISEDECKVLRKYGLSETEFAYSSFEWFISGEFLTGAWDRLDDEFFERVDKNDFVGHYNFDF